MTEIRRDLIRAWIGIGLAPVAAAASFQLRYMMVPFTCQSGNVLSLHVVTLIAITLSAYGLLTAVRTWRHSGPEWPQDQDGPLNRNRFLGLIGTGFSSAMLLLLIYQAVPVFFLDPCTIG